MPDNSDVYYWLSSLGLWERVGDGPPKRISHPLPLRPVRLSFQYFEPPAQRRVYRGPWDLDYDWAFCHALGIRWD